MEGVEVRANRWFTTQKGITNIDANYSCNGEFKRDATYSIKWDRHQFSLRSDDSGQAKFNGSKRKGNWNLNIVHNGNLNQWFYAVVFRGAYHYYYKDILNLKRTPLNNAVNPQMKIACYNDIGRANHSDERRFLGIVNWIKMYRREEDREGNVSDATAQRLTQTTFHELSHASHWELRRSKFDNKTTSKLKEIWALAVGLFLADEYYYSGRTYFWQQEDSDELKKMVVKKNTLL